jgi:hypothetical protein
MATKARRRDLESRLLMFFGGLLLDTTAHLARGAVNYVRAQRRRSRRPGRR